MNLNEFILLDNGFIVDSITGFIYLLSEKYLTNTTSGEICEIRPNFLINTKMQETTPFTNLNSPYHSYWTNRFPSGLTGTTDSDTQITLNWTNNGNEYDSIRVEQSIAGASYVEIVSLAPGVSSYIVSGLTQGTSHTYQIRYHQQNYNYSNYCSPHNRWTATNFPISATGTGVGVCTMKLKTTTDATITIDGNGRFYDNAAGTTNPGFSRPITGGSFGTFYLKVTGGTSNMLVYHNGDFTNFGDVDNYGWESYANAPSLNAPFSGFSSCILSLDCAGNNAVSGISSDIPRNMEYIYLPITYSTAYVSGAVIDLPRSLTSVTIGKCGFTGDTKDLSRDMLYISISSSAYKVGPLNMTGTLIDLPRTLRSIKINGASTITGSFTDLPTGSTSFISLALGTFYGDLGLAPSSLDYISVYSTTYTGLTYTTGRTWAQPFKRIDLLTPDNSVTVDSTITDNILIELAPLTWTGSVKAAQIAGYDTVASASAITTLRGKGVTVTVA